MSFMSYVRIVACVLLSNVWLQQLAAEDGLDFDTQVAPIFEARCTECHRAEEDNGGLRLDSSIALSAETDSGKSPLVAGDPDSSELLQRVLAESEDIRMPPDGDRLTSRQIETLRKWIQNGAVWPKAAMAGELSESPQETSSDHWAFQPIVEPDLPSVRESGWALSPVDYFVQAQRESAALSVAGDASPQHLVRRVSYALTGLPPTAERVVDFEKEVAETGDLPGALAGLVDEMLGQRTYGERWGRHWMDWVRYADTAGCNSDFPIPQAYLYRNYIIDAFNEDMPYDQFLTEQLAGDLMSAGSKDERRQRIIATGYLAMARRFGSLVETYPWHLTIEDTIDNVGRTMMGLTLACARCHDHKFDPISTRDYYGLYGIFESTQYAFPGIELFQVQHDLIPLVDDEELERVLGDHAQKTKKLEAELAEALKVCRKKELENAELEPSATVAERRAMHDELQGLLIKARNKGNKLADHLKERPDYPAAYAVRDAKPTNARVQLKGEPARPGAEVPRKFPEVLGGFQVEDTKSSGRLELAKWIANSKNPLTARVIVNRVWQRHFGRGLVGSTSDFGLRGEQPSHPELLDWLASDFMKNGWSIKHLHRTILNSRTYMLSSTLGADIEGQAVERWRQNVLSDPTNRYFWRFNRQRLDAESIRDTVLWVARQLDTTPQTEPFPIPPQKKWKYTQHHPFKDDYPSRKRSVYQLTKRLTVESYMQTFDGPDPNVCTSKRDQSVTSLQALFFVNDRFMHEQAAEIARQLLESSGGVEERVQEAVCRVLGRPATTNEVELLTSHLAATNAKINELAAGDQSFVAADIEVYASLIRGLFRLNEFVYVD
jgi:hypothetical protein